MTDAELKELLRPHVARMTQAFRPPAPAPATFSESHEPADGTARPATFYAAAGFSADDAGAVGRYFAADDDGHYPGDVHRYFGLNVRDFADRSHLVRKQIETTTGRRWYWVNPEKGKHAGKEDTPAAPHELAAEHVEQLARHLDTLPRDRLRDLARQVQVKMGSRKAELVQRLLDHVKGRHDPTRAPGAALERGERAKDNQARIDAELAPADREALRPDRTPAPEPAPEPATREPTLEQLETGVRPGGGPRAKHLDPLSSPYRVEPPKVVEKPSELSRGVPGEQEIEGQEAPDRGDLRRATGEDAGANGGVPVAQVAPQAAVMPTATDTDDAVNPAELLAYALILTKDAGDDDAYARLRGLDPDELGDLLGDDEPDDDDASEVHPEDFAAFADRPDGSQWQTNGRWYKREGGRTFRVSNPQQTQQPAPAGKPAAPEPEPKAEPAPAAKPAKPEAPAKPDPKAVHAEVAAAFAAPHTLTPEKLAGLTEKLKTLGVEQLKALQADRAAGGKVKADRVAKLVAWAKAQTAPKPPEKPAPHAAARAALDAHGIAHGHLTDAEVSDRLRAAFAPKPAVAPAKPAAAKKPTPAPKPAAKKPAAPAGPPRTDAGKAVAAIYDRAASASDADVEAAKAHLAKMPADEVARTAAAMGMVGKATKAAVLARITDRRGTAVRGRLLDRPAGPLSGEHIDRTEKELNDTAALDRSDPAGSPARADAAVARLKATHTADEIRELSRRLTGKAGRTPDESLARIHGELTPVSRLLDSQKV